MESNFVPYGIYQEIINIIGQWKVIDAKSLMDQCAQDIKYHNFMKKLRRLEQSGLLKSTDMGRRKKHVYLSSSGIKFTKYDTTFEISEENLSHDVIVGTVLRNLLSLDNFYAGKMYHQLRDDRIFPDATIKTDRNGKELQIAIEVELTQKSESRVKEKYTRYGKGEIFSHCIYVTNKSNLFKTYSRYLQQMNDRILPGIILVLDEKLSATSFHLNEAQCFYMEKKCSFGDLFLESKELN